MAFVLTWDRVWVLAPSLLGAAAQVLIAAWIYRLAPRDVRYRSLALLLVLNASWDLVDGFARATSTLAGAHLWMRLEEYIAVWTSLALVAFLAHYPRTRRVARSRGFLPALVLVGVAATVAFATVPALLGSMVGPNPTPDGWVLLFPGFFDIAILWALFAVWELQRDPDDGDVSMLLVAMALINYLVANAGGALSRRGPGALLDPVTVLGITHPLLVWDVRWYALLILAALALVPLLVFTAARHPRGGPRLAGFLAAVAGVAFLAGWFGSWFGFTAVLFAVIVGYALARHKLLDIDLKLKWTLEKSTVAAVFVAVVFVASEAAQEFFAGVAGSQYLGIIAAGSLVFALAPLQRFAGRVADATMPEVKDTPAYLEQRARELYRAAVESGVEDGIVTDRERDMLARLQDELGLTGQDVLELEREVLGSSGGDR